MLVSTTLQSTIHEDAYDEFDGLDDEFIVVPLDLLSGIVQGLGNTVEPFVTRSTLLPLLAVCAHYVSYLNVFILCHETHSSCRIHDTKSCHPLMP
jgi:hypothetical protein